MTVYKLFAAANPADSLASLDIVADGVIEAILGCLEPTYAGADGTTAMEVSFASSSGLATNDTRSSFFAMVMRHDFTTSGGAVTSHHVAVPGLSIPVAQGERLYLHASGTAVSTRFIVYLYVNDKMGTTGRRTRQ